MEKVQSKERLMTLMGEPKSQKNSSQGPKAIYTGLVPAAYGWWKNYWDCWTLVPKPAHEGFKGNIITFGEYGDVSVEGLQAKVWFKVGIYEYKLCIVIASLLQRMYHCNGYDVWMGTLPLSESLRKGCCASLLLPPLQLDMLDRKTLELPESTQVVNLKQYRMPWRAILALSMDLWYAVISVTTNPLFHSSVNSPRKAESLEVNCT